MTMPELIAAVSAGAAAGGFGMLLAGRLFGGGQQWGRVLAQIDSIKALFAAHDRTDKEVELRWEQRVGRIEQDVGEIKEMLRPLPGLLVQVRDQGEEIAWLRERSTGTIGARA